MSTGMRIRADGAATAKHGRGAEPGPSRGIGFHGAADSRGSNGAPANDGAASLYSATNGRDRSRRRKRGERRKRRKGSRLRALLGAGCLVAGGIVAISWWGASELSVSQTASPSDAAIRIAGDVGGGGVGDDGGEKAYERTLRGLPDNGAPLTEAQEQEVLKVARDELDRFPASVGSDGGGRNNPGWETIEHPGNEALRHSKGDAYVPPPRRKRATASELAGVLSRKKLRGGSENSDASGGGDPDGLGGGHMRVPKFWDPPPYGAIADERERRGEARGGSEDDGLPRDGTRRYLGNFGSRLMTPAEAKSIGSRVGTLETIFVAVASYRDWQCSQTVESAFSRASHPERIRIAVVDQIRRETDAPCSTPPKGPCDRFPDQATCRHVSQVDYLTVDADLSVGPVFARHLGHRLYRGEYFAMQSDAHVAFVAGWDDEIVAQWKQAKNEMAILSTYLSGTEKHIDLETGERLSLSRPIMCMSDFEGAGDYKHLRHGQQPEGVPFLHEPVLDPFWAAGFSFGRGHFVVNVPYDQHLPWIFQGEEISIGLRGFSYGYDFYSPEKSVCYHFYGRKDVPMFWENSSTYRGSGTLGMNRLNAIIHMDTPSHTGKPKDWIRTDERKYGLGKARDLQRFFDVFGIHVKRQTVEQHLCSFVGRPMQKEFKPFLRDNEMGLDYDKITYRYKDGK